MFEMTFGCPKLLFQASYGPMMLGQEQGKTRSHRVCNIGKVLFKPPHIGVLKSLFPVVVREVLDQHLKLSSLSKVVKDVSTSLFIVILVIASKFIIKGFLETSLDERSLVHSFFF